MEINYFRTNITFTPEKCLLGADNPVILPHSKAFQTHLLPPPGPEEIRLEKIKNVYIKLDNFALFLAYSQICFFLSTSSVGSSIKVSVFISTVRPCKILTSQDAQYIGLADRPFYFSTYP